MTWLLIAVVVVVVLASSARDELFDLLGIIGQLAFAILAIVAMFVLAFVLK